MATITDILDGDLISASNEVINNNFDNLNTDKIETSYLDTDTAMAANSDVKIPSQKAVKTYIDTSGGANASETVRGIVEEATDAEVTAGTATGATGAKLVVTPAKLATRLTSVLASYEPTVVYKCGTATKDTADASATQTIAHGLGATPSIVRITATCPSKTVSASFAYTVYNGTTQASSYLMGDTGTGTNEFAGNGFVLGSDNTDYYTGVVTFDATNISIAWTKTGNPSGTAYLTWEVQ